MENFFYLIFYSGKKRGWGGTCLKKFDKMTRKESEKGPRGVTKWERVLKKSQKMVSRPCDNISFKERSSWPPLLEKAGRKKKLSEKKKEKISLKSSETVEIFNFFLTSSTIWSTRCASDLQDEKTKSNEINWIN